MTKRYEELTFADDFMFCKILSSNPELCRELTRLITGKKVGKVVNLSRQKPVEITADGRGVRFDVYMADDLNTVYNIEMQVGSIADLPLRTRYYQGMIDLDLLERGSKLTDLKESYVIFICLENLFPDVGLQKYTFSSTCKETPNLELGDKAYKIILSAKGNAENISEDLKAFLEYVSGEAPRSYFTKRLDDLVEKSRAHIEWRKEYMTLLERDERMREEGRREGLEKGRMEGRESERINTAHEAARADAAEREIAKLKAEIELLKKKLS